MQPAVEVVGADDLDVRGPAWGSPPTSMPMINGLWSEPANGTVSSQKSVALVLYRL